LKKINKDRNAKTTRNVQEGLPFSISDVKRQTNDEKLLAAVRRHLLFRVIVKYSQTGGWWYLLIIVCVYKRCLWLAYNT